MKPFSYAQPAEDAAAVDAGRMEGAMFIAGGTGVVDLLRLGVEAPVHLVDINRLAWSDITTRPDGGLRIGALVKNTELATHPDVVDRYPALSQAILAGASPQIRNMASVGGNLGQRTRCPYFRDLAVSRCNKRTPGSGCAAVGGLTRMHAILGGSDQCIAVHPSDMCVALSALDASVNVRGPQGTRTIAILDFHREPGDRPDVDNTLTRGELVTSVDLPRTAFAARSTYLKVRDRASYAFALVSAAVALELRGGTIRDARVALGGIATRPWRSREVEDRLRGRSATRATFEQAARAVCTGARPQPGNAFKVTLAPRVVVRALEQALSGPEVAP